MPRKKTKKGARAPKVGVMTSVASTNVDSEEAKLDQLVEFVRSQILEKIDFTTPRTDFEFLAKFIRAKKYRAEEAVGAICKYYKSIETRSDLFKGLRVSDFSRLFESGALQILKGDADKVTVVLMSMDKWDPCDISLEQLILASAFYIEEALLDPTFQIHGVKAIVDLSGLSFKHVRALSYSSVKFAVKLVVDTYPVRIAGIHHVNAPLIFLPIFKISSSFFPQKLRERLTVHRDHIGLENYVPQEVLPKSLGGELEEDEAWDSYLLQNLMEKDICYDSYWKAT